MFWFDLDNSPHVTLFRYFFIELKKRGFNYIITARDYAQTKELLELYGIHYKLIGKHAGKNKIKKVINLLVRSIELMNFIYGKKINLAISHGSRTQLVAAKTLKIKTFLMMDYEYTENKIFNLLSDYILMPVFIPEKRLLDAGIKISKVRKYNGFKEEFYLSKFSPDNKFREALGISDNDILTVIRPPSMESNYHNRKSEELLLYLLDYLKTFSNNIILIVCRTNYDKQFIESNIKINNNIFFLDRTVDGLQLLYAADLVVSGGGTMNREAALLGSKTYSIFTGKRPYLDEYLESINRLKFINSIEDIKKISVERVKDKRILIHSNNLVSEVIDLILNLLNN